MTPVQPPALIVIGGFASDAEPADEESRCARRLLEDALPRVMRFSCGAADWPALVGAAVSYAADKSVNGESTALLLAHDRIAPAPETLMRLASALARGAVAACARSQFCPPPEAPADYLTLRGMERYARRLAGLPASPCRFDASSPCAMLATIDALRAGAWRHSAIWAPGAYCHDFSGYRSGMRAELLPFVPARARRVLDVGGGEGGFLAALKADRPDCVTHLAEMSASACRIAAGVVDRVWQGDFLSLDLPAGYDCITFLDVIEHTARPGDWLRRARGLLARDGVIIVSIPNVGHWSVIADLLEGRWDYAPAGIHCVTHLRFFTRAGVLALLEEAGFRPERFEARRIDPPPWFDASALGQALAIDEQSIASYSFTVVAGVAE